MEHAPLGFAFAAYLAVAFVWPILVLLAAPRYLPGHVRCIPRSQESHGLIESGERWISKSS